MNFISFLLAAILHLLTNTAVALTPPPEAHLRFYSLQIGASSIANILRFQSTMIIPAGPCDSSDKAINYLWPGLEPTQDNGVLQNVIGNGKPGEWFLEPYYCCNPVKMLVPSMRVYPGDTLTNTYSLNIYTMKWHVDWLIIPGPNGHAAGMESFSGGVIFDPNSVENDSTTAGEHYNTAIFAIELQGLGQWDFGPLSWRDIIIEINTTDTTWCKGGPYLNGGAPFNYTFSAPVPSIVDGVTRCYIAEMNFESL